LKLARQLCGQRFQYIVLIGSGYYEDDYTKVGEEWKFASPRLVEMDMAIALRDFKVR
jgi:hypothetical protein